MNAIIELFGYSVATAGLNWSQIIGSQQCAFLGRKCYKVRKSEPDTAIGSCTVRYGRRDEPLVICPTRLIEHGQVFTDCLHLLTTHEPGNELHLVPEVTIPGGTVDYFLVSTRGNKVKDFVGIELQALDTTGTVWSERQRLLQRLDTSIEADGDIPGRPFGINWKMTSKTTLLQMHHKIQTFEHVNKKLVLIMQDRLLAYMSRQFSFGHVKRPAVIGDSMQFHAYSMEQGSDGAFALLMQARLSTDAEGVGISLGLQAEARVELEQILQALQPRLSPTTRFTPRF
jgi:hypothetical protein